MPLPTPTAMQVRQVLPDDRHLRSTWTGVLVSLVTFSAWASLVTAVGIVHPWWAKILLGISAGIAAAPCFVVAHDACHGSLTPYARLNKVIGRIMFLPSLHPYSSWEHTHNGLHHGWTNVRGHEVAYVPFTKDEYDRLPRWRRRAERFFRTPCGTGPFYFFTVWIPHEMFPSHDRAPGGARRRLFEFDRLLVSAFAVFWIIAEVGLARMAGSNIGVTLIGGFVASLVGLHAVLGTVSFLHHTHPAVAWYDGAEERDFFRCQVRASIHLAAPRLIEVFLCDVLQHTAHHTDPRIPLYRLAESQARLNGSFPADVLSERWSWGGYVRVFRTCHLFDYKTHQWLDYDGTPLTPPLLEHSGVGTLEKCRARDAFERAR